MINKVKPPNRVAASNGAEPSGKSQFGKNGRNIYIAKVKATIVQVQGLNLRIHKFKTQLSQTVKKDRCLSVKNRATLNACENLPNYNSFNPQTHKSQKWPKCFHNIGVITARFPNQSAKFGITVSSNASKNPRSRPYY